MLLPLTSMPPWPPFPPLIETNTNKPNPTQPNNSGQEVTQEQTACLQALLEGSLLCNDSALSKDDATCAYTPNGAPTEVSLITAALKAGLQPKALKNAKPRVASVPFESEHKVCNQ